jgi:hypothetical protein
MNAPTFDSLSFSQRLKASGFSEMQTNTLACEIREVAREDHLVTKDFLRDQLEKIELKLEKFEMRITIKTGSMIFMLGGLLVAIKYFG